MTAARSPVLGFTLLEMLVAIAIFAVVSTLALTGYTQLQQQSEYLEQRLSRLREVQRAVQTLCQDLEQLEPRPVREPLGDGYLPALQVTDTLEYRLQLTRAGWSNTGGLPRPTLQRVGYRVEDEQLWRDHWPTLDRTLVVEPVKVRMLDGVRGVTFRFLTSNRQWVDRWPAQQVGTRNERSRPAAIEVVIDLKTGRDPAPRGDRRMTPVERSRQRGVALITAVLIVALGTMLAAGVFFRGYLDRAAECHAVRARTRPYEVALGARPGADFLPGSAGVRHRSFRRSLGETPAAAATRRWRHCRGASRRHAGPLQSEQPSQERRHDQRGRRRAARTHTPDARDRAVVGRGDRRLGGCGRRGWFS